MNPISWIRTNVARLTSLKDPPHTIALGVAIGMFFGLIPLWGLKTLLAIGVTRLLRGSIVAAAIAVTLHDIALPLVPLLLRWEYDVGYWLLSHPHALPPKLHMSHQNPINLVPLVDLFYHRSAVAARLVGCGGPRFHRHLFSHPRGGRTVAAQERFCPPAFEVSSLNELPATDSAPQNPAGANRDR